MAAANIASPKPLDGVNLLPFLAGQNSTHPHKNLYWRYSDGAGYAVRTGDYKLIYSGYKEKLLLFDLATDPYEQENLADKEPGIVQELSATYQAWNKALIPAKWYDPHPENILKEEQRRRDILEKAKAGETRFKNNSKAKSQ